MKSIKNIWQKVCGLALTSLSIMTAASFISGCDGNQNEKPKQVETSTEKVFNIGAMQIIEHPSLDRALQGFKQALLDKGINVKYNLQNAQGDMNNNNIIAQNFVGDKVDLIFANSTPCAQAALSATKDIPIIFTSLSDPVSAQLVPSLNETTGNITGTIDTHPQAIPSMVKFIANEFDGKRIGMIYNAGEQNSITQVELVKKEAKKVGLKVIPVTVSNTSEVKLAAQSLIGRIDFIYIISDNTVVSAIKSVIDVANEEKIPLFTGELDSVKLGAFAAYGFDYQDIGYEAGEMAAQILTADKTISQLPVQYPKNLKLLINKSAAEKMGITLKQKWDAIAEYIEA